MLVIWLCNTSKNGDLLFGCHVINFELSREQAKQRGKMSVGLEVIKVYTERMLSLDFVRVVEDIGKSLSWYDIVTRCNVAQIKFKYNE